MNYLSQRRSSKMIRILTRKKIISMLVITFISTAVIIACSGEGRAKEKPRFTFKEGQGPAGAVVSIDGKTFTDEELVGDEKLEFADLQKKIYDLRMERVGQLVFQKVYGDKAQEAKMSLDEYIDSKVFKGEPKVSEKEVDLFAKEKRIPKEQLTNLKDRIQLYLKAQKRIEERTKLLVKLSKEHKVEVYFNKPNIKVDVAVGQAPTLGSENAKVKIIEFSDFQCPYCSQAATTVNQIKKIYGKKILLAFKHFPLPMHSQAKAAAEASMCVHEQSTDRYWKYHDKLFANQSTLDEESLKKFAKEVGADQQKFNECLNAKKYSKLVQDDLEYGSRLGVRSTPTFFINGKIISGALPLESFKEIIDEELSGG